MLKDNSKILPAEWEEQSAIQLTWPHINTDWSENLKEVTNCFITLTKEISQRQKVIIICPSSKEIIAQLDKNILSKISFVTTDTNDTWARDHGGITIKNCNKIEILDFQFNGWGLKFASNFDNIITTTLFNKNIFKADVKQINKLDFVLEGGSIESDGAGTILTTSECLLSANRNGINSKEEIEQYFKIEFGTKKILWLDYGFLEGDDTDSHIDTLARFCTPNIIAYVDCTDKNDIHFEQLQKMKQQLESFKTIEGNPYTLVALPMADPVYWEDERLPATYANFLIINGAVLVPFYNTNKDGVAKEIIQKIFPNRQVIGIDCSSLIQQHGSLHCVTMQYPIGAI